MLVLLRDGSVQTILRAATLRQEFVNQTFYLTTPSDSILIPCQPVTVLTLCRHAPGRVATGVPNFK